MDLMDIDVGGLRGDLLALEEMVDSRGWKVLLREFEDTEQDNNEQLAGIWERLSNPDGDADPRDVLQAKTIQADQRRLLEIKGLPAFLIQTWKNLLEMRDASLETPDDDSEGINKDG